MIRSISILLLFFHSFYFSIEASSTELTEPFTRVIPIRIVQNLMFTDVTIDGEVYNFLIDTGAPFVLSPELADKLNFRPKQTMKIGSSNAKSGVARVGTIKRDVEVGGLKFSNFKALVLDYGANTQVIRCLGFDGIIGANFMGGAIWHIDYDNKEITITNELRKIQKIKEAWSVKMEKRGFNKSPYLAVKVNKGTAARVLFDSGFSGFFDLSYSSYYKALKEGRVTDEIKVLEGRGRMAEGVFGAVDTTGFYMQVPRLMVGREEILKPEFRMSHTSKAKIGAEYLKGRLVTLDFPRKRFYVYEKENKYVPLTRSSFLFGATMKNGKMKVSSIFGKLEESGELKMDDELISVNGKVLGEMGECEALSFVRNQLTDEESMEIRAKRAGKEFNLKLYKSLIFSAN